MLEPYSCWIHPDPVIAVNTCIGSWLFLLRFLGHYVVRIEAQILAFALQLEHEQSYRYRKISKRQQ